MLTKDNFDPAELAKFSDQFIAGGTRESEFRPLHEINPLRLDWIDGLVPLRGLRVLDVGCGGGILADSMARMGADVLGIDSGEQGFEGGSTSCAGGADSRCGIP